MPRKIWKGRRTLRTLKNQQSITSDKKKREFRFKQMKPWSVKPEPFPRVLYTRMKYAVESGITAPAATGVAASVVFRLNSIYDPYHATGGTTVTGHATMSGIYDSYLVTGAKVNIRFYNPSSDQLRIGCRLRMKGSGATTGADVASLLEQPMTYQSGLADSGKQLKTFNFFVRPWTLMGLSKLEYFANTSLYGANMTANPSYDNCLMDIFAVDPTGTGASCRYVVKIVYYVQCYERKYLSST